MQISRVFSDPALIRRIKEQNTTIGVLPVRTVGTEGALRGETGTQIFPDFRGVPVLSSYKPINLPDLLTCPSNCTNSYVSPVRKRYSRITLINEYLE